VAPQVPDLHFMCAQGPLLCGSFDVCRSPLMFGYGKNPPPPGGISLLGDFKNKNPEEEDPTKKKTVGFLTISKGLF